MQVTVHCILPQTDSFVHLFHASLVVEYFVSSHQFVSFSWRRKVMPSLTRDYQDIPARTMDLCSYLLLHRIPPPRYWLEKRNIDMFVVDIHN